MCDRKNGCLVKSHDEGCEYDENYFEKELYYIPYFDAVAKVLIQKFSPLTVLDVGCSLGPLVSAFRKEEVFACGIDLSDYALTHAQAASRGWLLRVDTDRSYLPFKDESFDLVTLLEVIEHIQNYEHLIGEIRRILKPNGCVFLTAPTKINESRAIITLRKDPTHINVHSRRFWIRTFERHNFEHVNGSENLRKMISHYTPPGTPIGKILGNAGKCGESLRVMLSYCLLSPTYLFKKI